MKRNIILAALLGLVSASTVFAATITTSTTIGGGSFTPSAKVGINVVSLSGSYAATSAHVSGTFEYGTVGGTGVTGDPAKILKKAYTAASGATVGAPTAPASAVALADGYAE
ncbi:MAG: hypothetical protein ACOYL3_23105 [Desulfuromonadaceae bacterium]